MRRLLLMVAALAAGVSLTACGGMNDYSSGGYATGGYAGGDKSTHDKGTSDETMGAPAAGAGGGY
jgi:major membrane immunogen (membrane-anchored lipoprotein)